MQIQKIRELKNQMSDDQKRRLLVGLRKFRESVLGGEPVEDPSGNMLTTEDEFTGTGVSTSTEPKTIAKTFDTEADFDSYIQQRRGIEMTPKELTAIQNFREARPTMMDKFMVKYEATDEFGQNDTTVIKKLREPESGQFCWTAFSTHEAAEDEGKPEEPEETGDKGGGEDELPDLPDLKEQDDSHMPSEPDNDEVTVGDKIRISKSITFADETQGADILANFLQALDI